MVEAESQGGIINAPNRRTERRAPVLQPDQNYQYHSSQVSQIKTKSFINQDQDYLGQGLPRTRTR